VLSTGLHVCRECNSMLVEPRTCEPVGTTRWLMKLACPECGWWTAGVWEDEELARLELVLAHATASILADCEALARASSDDAVRGFAEALRTGAITPADF
jgi:hypothetical protein